MWKKGEARKRCKEGVDRRRGGTKDNEVVEGEDKEGSGKRKGRE